MSLQLPEISKKLPQGITLESLYQINNQSVWFLIWILKKERFWSDITREVLETPFTINRTYGFTGLKHYLEINKNNYNHGISYCWYRNGQLIWEEHWKDGEQDGISRAWYENGQLLSETCWKNGQKDGIERNWHDDGHLDFVDYWKDGVKIFTNYQKN